MKKLNGMAGYRSIFLYLVFGIATTAINIAAYFLCAKILGIGILYSNVLAWVFAVIFAYITNRKWVFESSTGDLQGIIGEMAAFFGCRFATGFLDMAIMYLGSEVMKLDDMLVKYLANGLVILANFAASKLFVFRKQHEEGAL